MTRTLAVLALLAATRAAAGDFGVSPIRVELDRGTKSALVTVSNEDSRPLAFQVRALAWTQDAAGADRYTDTADLVYFPQQLKVPPKESRVVRVGYKVPALQQEKTYRLFIEELADPAREPSKTGVAITLRFGVPVFLRPSAPQLAGALELAAAGGVTSATARNTGNVHFRIATVRFTGLGAGGETVFEHALDGWYLLAGAQRPYRYSVPVELCARVRLLRVEADAEKLNLRAERALGPEDCR
jgi:fimbrial chaperone protein